MNPLPQRKKSAEEIAKLRESFGVPGQAPETTSTPAETTVAKPALPPATAETPPEKTAAPVRPPAKEVHSLKRSERIPVLHPDDEEPAEIVSLDAAPAEVLVTPTPAAAEPKIVRSLRKSEQGPVLVAHRSEPRPDSTLPVHRHSDEEISRLRRMEVIGSMASQERPPVLAAHPALLAPGYLLAAATGAGVYFYDVPLAAAAACVGLALLISVFIFIRRPLSRHHAAFILMAVLFVVVFGALHYFPQIQHGT